MATSAPTLTLDNSTTASFRAWGLGVSTALQAVGLVKTTDTGQIDWTTVSAPASTSLSVGYEIYKLNDSLQATKPIYMKIEYGSANVAARPSIWITYSTNTNGAGTMNGSMTSGRYQGYGVQTSGPVQCYFSGDGSSLTMILNGPNVATSSSVFVMGVFFDRTRDSTGNITSDAFQWMMSSNIASTTASVQHASRFGNSSTTSNNDNSNVGSVFTHGIISFRLNSSGAVGATSGAAGVYTGTAFFQVPATAGNSSQYLGDTYYFPQVITSPNVSYGLMMLAGFNLDLPSNLTSLTVPVLGSSHTYLVTGYDFTAFGGPGSYIRMLVRYE